MTEDQLRTKKYLEYVVKNYGREERVGHLWCKSGWDGPYEKGEYSACYGRAGELLDKFDEHPFYIPGI